jgi:hypothetical protein
LACCGGGAVLFALDKSDYSSSRPSRSTALRGQSMEAKFKSGMLASVPPVGMAPTSAFLPGYPDPTVWLHRTFTESSPFSVIVSNNPDVNCGMTPALQTGEAAAACYSPKYYRTIFLYWTPAMDDATKKFMLAFGWAGSRQWWEQFDVMQSVESQAVTKLPEWRKVLQSDAICRVLSWGGYSAAVADRMGGCPTSSWSTGWLRTQAQALGVTVRQY